MMDTLRRVAAVTGVVTGLLALAAAMPAPHAAAAAPFAFPGLYAVALMYCCL